MRNTRMMTGLVAGLLLLPALVLAAPPATGMSANTPSIENLERELNSITDELTRIEERIDSLLQELIDPRVTSLSVFFSIQGLEGKVPLAIELQVDGKPLASRPFSETDRLILIRGGAIEVYGGVIEPTKQSLTVLYTLAPGEGSRGSENTGRAAFGLEPRRATANFVEVTLSPDASRKPGLLSLNARFWSKEP